MGNDKQRLVELFEELEDPSLTCPRMGTKARCGGCKYLKRNGCDLTERFVDYFLANGVIVPPYQIGETVYVIIENMPFFHAGVYECEVEWYSFGKDGLRPIVKVKSDNIIDGTNLQVYLEDLYLTREEAEQALKGGAE